MKEIPAIKQEISEDKARLKTQHATMAAGKQTFLGHMTTELVRHMHKD